MVDFATQRLNMVESQVRPSDVTDRRITSAMRRIAREEFLPDTARAIAYADTDLAVNIGDAGARAASASLLAPRVLARMIQGLEIGDADIVLNIGCGTGYETAILSQVAQTVVAIDSEPALVAHATAALEKTGIDNAVVIEAPLADGHAEEGPYDAILIAGLIDDVPAALLDQLKDGGRLVTVISTGRFGAVTQWRRFGDSFDRRWLFDAGAPRLHAFDRPAAFAF